MKKYEYFRVAFDWGDLSRLNQLGAQGWKVIAVEQPNYMPPGNNFALMEREVSEKPK